MCATSKPSTPRQESSWFGDRCQTPDPNQQDVVICQQPFTGVPYNVATNTKHNRHRQHGPGQPRPRSTRASRSSSFFASNFDAMRINAQSISSRRTPLRTPHTASTTQAPTAHRTTREAVRRLFPCGRFPVLIADVTPAECRRKSPPSASGISPRHYEHPLREAMCRRRLGLFPFFVVIAYNS